MGVVVRHRRHPVLGQVVEVDEVLLDHPHGQHTGDGLAHRRGRADVGGVHPDVVVDVRVAEAAEVDRDAVVVDRHGDPGCIVSGQLVGDHLVDVVLQGPVRPLGVLPPHAGVAGAVVGLVAVVADQPVAEVAVAVPPVREALRRHVAPGGPAASVVVADPDPAVPLLVVVQFEGLERQHPVAPAEGAEDVGPLARRAVPDQIPVAHRALDPHAGVATLPVDEVLVEVHRHQAIRAVLVDGVVELGAGLAAVRCPGVALDILHPQAGPLAAAVAVGLDLGRPVPVVARVLPVVLVGLPGEVALDQPVALVPIELPDRADLVVVLGVDVEIEGEVRRTAVQVGVVELPGGLVAVGQPVHGGQVEHTVRPSRHGRDGGCGPRSEQTDRASGGQCCGDDERDCDGSACHGGSPVRGGPVLIAGP